MPDPKPGEEWHLKRNHRKVATVMFFDDETDPEWPNWKRGYVRLRAPWYRGGEGGKSIDTFLKQFEPHNDAFKRDAPGGAASRGTEG